MPPLIQLSCLQTEGRNPNSNNIDQVGTTELCQIINNEDATIAAAVEKCIPTIAAAIDELEKRGRLGGRVIYVGAGTSGRLGVLDASEIPPTYSSPSSQFIALIAGGDTALRTSKEGAEDDTLSAETDLKALDINPEIDTIIGIAASGRTPYVLRCLSFAKELGCMTVGIACCEPSKIEREGNVDFMISVVTGPEVVMGSTRMKAGTGTKLVLNMLSTGLMIRLGKTFGNRMIDVKATNAKLKQRSRDMIRSICGNLSPQSDGEIDSLLDACDGSVKLVVAKLQLGTSILDARERLGKAHGVLVDVIRTSSSTMDRKSISERERAGHYVLCVDGGGSKCAAVLLGPNGESGSGEAGECNVSNIDFDTAMSAISLAIKRAIDSCPSAKNKPLHTIHFKKIWVGLAGYERPSIAQKVNIFLSKLFQFPAGENQLKVTSDVDLLVTICAKETNVDSLVVLLVGTGSIAMAYKREGGIFQRTGRVGGWGHLLGDDGSGYSIGRQALRLALAAADASNSYSKTKLPPKTPDPLIGRIFQHFGLNSEKERNGFLSKILSPVSNENVKSINMTRVIAEVAKNVLDSHLDSEAAVRIIDTSSQALVDELNLLVEYQEIKPETSFLVLAGGLMQSEIYRNMVMDKIASGGMAFGQIQTTKDPAFMAAQYMLEDTLY